MSERTIARSELVRQLGISPRLVRELVRQYHDWLTQPDAGRFTALDLARLQIAARGRLSGRPAQEIENQLLATLRQGEDAPRPRGEVEERLGAAQEAAASQEPAAAAAAGTDPVAMELQRLHQTLSDSAERERRDRDRMLTALMRTQQEVSSLRQELGAYRSRRQRKRGLMRWFRG